MNKPSDHSLPWWVLYMKNVDRESKLLLNLVSKAVFKQYNHKYDDAQKRHLPRLPNALEMKSFLRCSGVDSRYRPLIMSLPVSLFTQHFFSSFLPDLDCGRWRCVSYLSLNVKHCSLYILPSPLPDLDHPSTELRDPQTAPPQDKHTHLPRDTITRPILPPHKHTHIPGTHKHTPPFKFPRLPIFSIHWLKHILNAHTAHKRAQTQTHSWFSASHMFKHSVYTVVKCNSPHREQTAANSPHFHSQASPHEWILKAAEAILKHEKKKKKKGQSRQLSVERASRHTAV